MVLSLYQRLPGWQTLFLAAPPAFAVRSPTMSAVTVHEYFTSLQGESTYSGLPCFFVRLTGCNLRCTYCDTKYAYEGGEPVEIDVLVEEARRSPAPIVEITGGEPLMQDGFQELALRLRDDTAKRILVETNGSLDISVIPDKVVAIMDVKCPGSGHSHFMDWDNIERLRPYDEVKFVLGTRNDYEWAKALINEDDLIARCHAVFFSPVEGILESCELAEWLAEDGFPVRLQVQLHKVIGVK